MQGTKQKITLREYLIKYQKNKLQKNQNRSLQSDQRGSIVDGNHLQKTNEENNHKQQLHDQTMETFKGKDNPMYQTLISTHASSYRSHDKDLKPEGVKTAHGFSKIKNERRKEQLFKDQSKKLLAAEYYTRLVSLRSKNQKIIQETQKFGEDTIRQSKGIPHLTAKIRPYLSCYFSQNSEFQQKSQSTKI